MITVKRIKTILTISCTTSVFFVVYYLLHSVLVGFFYSDGVSPNITPDDFNDALYFIKYGRDEIKGLAIQFLTLLTAILVFSITFSEKIINYSQASKAEKTLVTVSWVLLVLSIILDGIGLVFNTFALPFALRDNNIITIYNRDSYTFYPYAFNALYAMVMSGYIFVVALICIVSAGIVKLYKN